MTTFAHFKSALQQLAHQSIAPDSASCSGLLIPERSDARVRTYYAPFDHVNTQAKLVLVGITPGREQMNNALKAAASAMDQGLSDVAVIARAKQAASFSGPMREKLIAMLDHYGFQKRLGLGSCRELWGTANQLVHFTSALRNPVFCLKDGQEENYTGGSPTLSAYAGFKPALAELRSELMSIPDALILPLGDKVATVLQSLVLAGDLPVERVLNLRGTVVEFPHPSGANGESHALALMSRLPTTESYASDKLAAYRDKVQAKGKRLTSSDERNYLNKRSSYWNRAQSTRLAIESLA